MRWSITVCLVVLLLSGCGGVDDRPDLETSPTTLDELATTEPAAAKRDETVATVSTGVGVPTHLTPRQ